MSSSDAPPRPPAARFETWAIVAGVAAILAGYALWQDGDLNLALFDRVNPIGASAPALWSSLSVLGLGLATWIFLSAFARAHPERVARLFWVLVVGGIVMNRIKHAFQAPRPFLALGEGHLVVIGTPLQTMSLPSGHSAMAFAMLALMVAETRRRADVPAARRAAEIAGWAILAMAITVSRVAVGAHWPADAVMGAGLGLLFAGLSPRAWPVAGLTRFLQGSTGRRTLALGLVVAGLAIATTPALLAEFGLARSTLAKRLATGYPLAEPVQWALGLVALAGAWRWWR